MARVKIAPAKPDTLNEELARLRKFDVETLRGRWCSLFGRRAPSHLPRHLLYRLLAYRLQADRFKSGACIITNDCAELRAQRCPSLKMGW